ncbi:MAG: PPC domain-containing DNA-binding protein [Chloroflexota bacterium]
MGEKSEWLKETSFISEAATMGRVIVGRILPGSDLVTGIEEICRKHGVQQAMITGTIGSVVNPEFDWASTTEERPGTGHTSSNRIEGAGSLISGQGLVCRNENGSELDVHLHCTITDPCGAVYGGHFPKGTVPVLSTIDVTLIEIAGVKLIRRPHPVTGKLFTFIEPE